MHGGFINGGKYESKFTTDISELRQMLAETQDQHKQKVLSLQHVEQDLRVRFETASCQWQAATDSMNDQLQVLEVELANSEEKVASVSNVNKNLHADLLALKSQDRAANKLRLAEKEVCFFFLALLGIRVTSKPLLCARSIKFKWILLWQQWRTSS